MLRLSRPSGRWAVLPGALGVASLLGCGAPAPTTPASLPPACPAGVEARDFPPETQGAVYRAIVRLRIGVDGAPTELCVARVEGDAQFAEEAFGDVGTWRFPKERAGEARERIVTYRLRPRPPR